MNERTTTIGNGVSVAWLEAGEGDPPLLLLHGLNWGTAKWRAATRELGMFRRTLALNMPGCGSSDAPSGSYSPGWLAGAARAFMDDRGIERAFVVGNSYGGLVAIHLAAAWPDRVAGLVLAAPALPNDAPQDASKGLAFAAASMPGVGAIATAQYWKRDPEVIVAETLARNVSDIARIDEETVAALEEDARRRAASKERLRAALAAQQQVLWALTARRETTWRLFSGLTVPTVILWGDSDRVLPPAIGHAAIGRLPGAHLIVIDDCGHNPQMERPVEFAGAVTAFVRSLEAPADPAVPGSLAAPDPRVEPGTTPPLDITAPGGAAAGDRPTPTATEPTPTATEPPVIDAPPALAEHDGGWTSAYERERGRILRVAGEHILRLEHIGSTAVPGIVAEPTIDIAATVRDGAADGMRDALVRLGYEAAREPGAAPGSGLYRRGGGAVPTYLVRLVEASDGLRDLVLFRDYLAEHPAARNGFDVLKRDLVLRGVSRSEYIGGKGPFIRAILTKARLDADA